MFDTLKHLEYPFIGRARLYFYYTPNCHLQNIYNPYLYHPIIYVPQ